MRLRINDMNHFLNIVEKAATKTVFVDDHSGIFGTYYHIWFTENSDCIEIKIRNFDTVLFAITEISEMKREVRIVKWLNSRRY